MKIVNYSLTAIKNYYKLFKNPMNKYKHGQGIRVAIIDSGINITMVNKKMRNKIVCHYDFVRKKPSWFPKESIVEKHGTLCASIIHSLAPKCGLIDCCVTHNTTLESEQLINAINWAITESKADVINISVGTTNLNDIQKVRDVCHFAKENNTILIASCSNSGIPSLPSALDDVISITGLDLGECGKWCGDASQKNVIYSHSGPYSPRCALGESMVGNSAAAAAITGQIARILSSRKGIHSDIFAELYSNSSAII